MPSSRLSGCASAVLAAVLAFAHATVLTGCHHAGSGAPVASGAAGSGGNRAADRPAPRRPITLTYLGVAGWTITDGVSTVIVDPYLSRPHLVGGSRMVVDELAIAKHVPAVADLVIVGHSHVDHLLDAPAVALRTGAQVLGSVSTARYARASGVPEDRVITVKGGEDYEFSGFSLRVIPSLHSALDEKHTFAGTTEIAADAKPPLTFDEFAEGGTFAYLIRMAGHEILVVDTANFIERELEGIHPDLAIIGTGGRGQIHDYSCRLATVLGQPPTILANHFDAWREALEPVPPIPADTRADLDAFAAEIHRCSPSTTVMVPERFHAMTF